MEFLTGRTGLVVCCVLGVIGALLLIAPHPAKSHNHERTRMIHLLYMGGR